MTGVVMIIMGIFSVQPFFSKHPGPVYFLLAGLGLPVAWLLLVARREPQESPPSETTPDEVDDKP